MSSAVIPSEDDALVDHLVGEMVKKYKMQVRISAVSEWTAQFSRFRLKDDQRLLVSIAGCA